MNASIFKSYDIRGLAPQEIDAGLARRLGKALSHLFHPKRVLVGRDMRATSSELEEALIEAFLASGVSVTRVGLCSTPMFYAAVGEANGAYDLGVMVTASHNPAAYNGFKMVRSNCLPIGQGSGMEEIRDLAMSDMPLVDADGDGRGTLIEDHDLLTRYLNRLFALAPLSTPLPDWSIAVDAGNGMNGLVMPALKSRLPGIHLTPLYWDLDGTFPNHEANPLKIETLAELQRIVRKDGCAFGVAFDGDGDRVGFVDEQGTPIPGDILVALFAQEMLRSKGAGKILYDVRCSWSVPETITEAGGEPIMCRVGHAHIKKQMRETSALFGGELSMHFYFSDLWNVESGDFAFLLLLRLLMREQKPLSTIWKPLQHYVHSGEINFPVSDPTAVLARLEERYAAQATMRVTIDGLRLEFRDADHPEQDWWFNVRASNTEPLLRLNLETRTPEATAKRLEELTRLMQETMIV